MKQCHPERSAVQSRDPGALALQSHIGIENLASPLGAAVLHLPLRSA